MAEIRIKGKTFVLGSDIDTDQIIPAEHLVYSLENQDEKKLYGRYALSGVPEHLSGLPSGRLPFTEPDKYKSDYTIIIAGKNFGCGSSREHAPFALHIAGVKAVVAPTYARIFYRNAVDGGFLVPYESLHDLTADFSTGDEAEIDVSKNVIRNITRSTSLSLRPLGDVADIVHAGGIFEYARKNNMV